MHGVAFEVKRAHLRTVEVLKAIAGRFGLTPARFDVMYVLRARGGGCDQATLWRDLGVSRTTVSRMVQGLEDEGFVWRMMDPDDARRRQVVMTEWGLRRFLEAVHAAVRTEEVRALFDAIHERGRAFVREAWNVVAEIGLAFKNTARGFYDVEALDEEQSRVHDDHDADVTRELQRLETHRAAMSLRPARPDCEEQIAALAALDNSSVELSDEDIAYFEQHDQIDRPEALEAEPAQPREEHEGGAGGDDGLAETRSRAAQGRNGASQRGEFGDFVPRTFRPGQGPL